jgi:hypothetical protein
MACPNNNFWLVGKMPFGYFMFQINNFRTNALLKITTNAFASAIHLPHLLSHDLKFSTLWQVIRALHFTDVFSNHRQRCEL